MTRMAAVRRYLINILSYVQTLLLTMAIFCGFTLADRILTSVAYFRYECA